MKAENRCAANPELVKQLGQWLEQPPGAQLLAQELSVLQRVISDLFGYYLLELGPLILPGPPYTGERLKSHIQLGPVQPVGAAGSWITGDPGQLPIASDSVDAVLLQHTLEFHSDPHGVLREVERVLIAEGRLLVTTFNPWSLWGLWRGVRPRSRRVPWCGHFITQRRLQDWLSLLGFEVELVQPYLFRPPLRSVRVMERLSWMERYGARWWPLLAGGHLLVAVKRVSTLTPVKPAWKLRPAILTGRAIEPTTRSGRG